MCIKIFNISHRCETTFYMSSGYRKLNTALLHRIYFLYLRKLNWNTSAHMDHWKKTHFFIFIFLFRRKFDLINTNCLSHSYWFSLFVLLLALSWRAPWCLLLQAISVVYENRRSLKYQMACDVLSIRES